MYNRSLEANERQGVQRWVASTALPYSSHMPFILYGSGTAALSSLALSVSVGGECGIYSMVALSREAQVRPQSSRCVPVNYSPVQGSDNPVPGKPSSPKQQATIRSPSLIASRLLLSSTRFPDRP